MIERAETYVWPSWVTSLISGDKSCLWAAWFKAHFTKYEKVESDFDLIKWTADHAALVRLRADELRADGFTVTEEDQNSFKIIGNNGSTLSGKPDIVAIKENKMLVVDCKTGKKRNADAIQVAIYMLCLSSLPRHSSVAHITGEICYKASRDIIEFDFVDDSFRRNFKDVMNRVADDSPPLHTPSYSECRFCDIPSSCCSERVNEPDIAVGEEHDLF